MNKSLVSVIVPTYNSANFLEECLRSIQRQSYPEIELIVVDNHSSDNTKDIARQYTNKVYDKGPERSAQRNYGVQNSKGDYVLIIDSDMKLSTLVVETCVDKINENTDYKAIIIPEESFGEGFWAQCKWLERSFYIGVDWMEAARFFSRSIFDEMKGYNEKITGEEDYDLPQRIEEKYVKLAIQRINILIYHNEQKISLLKSCQKKFYYAQDINKYVTVEANKDKFKKQASIIARYRLFLSHPLKLFKNPILGLGMVFMKTCEFGSGGMGYLIGRIKNQ